MPRPRRSNFTSPTAAQSSLSHCRTLRSSMRAHSTGHTSTTGRSQITMPPEWMPRWRGKSSTCCAIARTRAGMSWSVCAAVTSARPQASTCLAHASCWPVAKPRALAMSRTADRAR